jgi:hypothetical protein
MAAVPEIPVVGGASGEAYAATPDVESGDASADVQADCPIPEVYSVEPAPVQTRVVEVERSHIILVSSGQASGASNPVVDLNLPEATGAEWDTAAPAPNSINTVVESVLPAIVNVYNEPSLEDQLAACKFQMDSSVYYQQALFAQAEHDRLADKHNIIAETMPAMAEAMRLADDRSTEVAKRREYKRGAVGTYWLEEGGAEDARVIVSGLIEPSPLYDVVEGGFTDTTRLAPGSREASLVWDCQRLVLGAQGGGQARWAHLSNLSSMAGDSFDGNEGIEVIVQEEAPSLGSVAK